MKKIICVLLAVVLAVGCLTACQQSSTVTETTDSEVVNGGTTTTGGGSTTTGDSVDNAKTISGTVGGTETSKGWASTKSKYTVAELEAAYPLRQGVKGEVKVFTPFPDDKPLQYAMENMKQVYPEVTNVKLISTSNVSRHEKLLALIQAGDSPDWVYTTYQDFPLRAAKGMCQPIDDLIQFHPAQSDSLMNNNCSYNGKRYAVIIETPISVLFYNKNLFQRKGEKTPEDYYKEGNWTWATLRQVAKKMTDAQNGIYGFATDMDWYFSECMGQDIIKFENGKAKLNMRGNQTYMDGHQFLIDMINVDKSTFPTHWAAHTEFGKGTVAMCFTGLNHTSFFHGFEYDYTLFPKQDANSPYYSTVGGMAGGFAIAKGAKNPVGGMAFGELLMSNVIQGSHTKDNVAKAYELAEKEQVIKVVPWFYGFGLEGIYMQDFCGWARTGTKDLNTLIEENASIFEAKLREYN
ncbi:MAG: extracellular solute-binding protein [Clostridia bacterium]|nr:extracellular solute-binding protein [Clostridia bacterium]